MHHLKPLYILLLGSILLIACGDDITKNYTNNSISFLNEDDELPTCEEDTKGTIYYKIDSSSFIYCSGESWISLKESIEIYSDPSNSGCDAKPIANGYKIICRGDSVGVVLNGADGKNGLDGLNGSNGENGLNGQNGYSCSAEKKDSNTVTISCQTADGVVSYDVKNGADGKNGTNGKDGKNGTDGTNGINGTNGNDGKDGTSCNAVAITGGYKIVCGKDSVGVVLNGNDGKNGINGTNGNDGKDGTSCNAVAITGGYKIVCGKDSVGVVLNGNDGKNGINGTNGNDGKDGTSCNAVAITGGYKIVCGEDSVGVVLNGKDGIDGTNEIVEAGCTISEDTEYAVTIVCGDKSTVLYKSICGSRMYDASVGFCYDNGTGAQVYKKSDYCGENTNYPLSSFLCVNDVPYAKNAYGICGTGVYQLSSEFCYNDGTGPKAYAKSEYCGETNNYPLTSYYCNNGNAYSKETYDICGSLYYETASEFCSDEQVYPKCNGDTYNASTEFCVANTKHSKCNGSTYNPSIQFCYNNEVLAKCGENEYDPSTQQCKGSIVYGTCGGVSYDVSKQICDTRDNQLYKYVVIGQNTWMAQNLNYNYNQGTAKSYCYNDVASNCKTYGRLYTWPAAMDSVRNSCGYATNCTARSVPPYLQGACPDGWRIPNKFDFDELYNDAYEVNYSTGKNIVATKLKSKSGWNDNGNGTDVYGFNALPGGNRSESSSSSRKYYNLGSATYFWTASDQYSRVNPSSNKMAYFWYFSTQSMADTVSNATFKYDAYSVRCIKIKDSDLWLMN